MEMISIAFKPDQLDTMILACGIAARNSMPENARRCRELQDVLIHAQVVARCAEYAKEDERAIREMLCAKLHSGAEYGKAVD